MGFQQFECKLEPFEQNSKHLNANSNHSKGIRAIPMQILTLRTRFEAFKCKLQPFKTHLKHFNVNFDRELKHSNANSYHSNEILSIRMQILTI